MKRRRGDVSSMFNKNDDDESVRDSTSGSTRHQDFDDDATNTKPAATAAQQIPVAVDVGNSVRHASLLQPSDVDVNNEAGHDGAAQQRQREEELLNNATTKVKKVINTSTNHNKCLQTPHTMRLLKLIRDGNTDYANIAIERLSTYCTTIINNNNNNSGSSSTKNNNTVVIWDLIGRLQSLLNVSTWSTRQIASYAIYIVAHNLPIQDQHDLFASSLSSPYNDDNTKATTSSSSGPCDHGEQQSSLNKRDDITNHPENVSSSTTITTTTTSHHPKEYITVQDLLEPEGMYSIWNIVRYGQELYSVPESQYTMTNNLPTTRANNSGISNHHSNTNNTAVNNNNDDDDYNNNNNFAINRVREQRQILATRLGLGMIADIMDRGGDGTNIGGGCRSSCIDTMIPNLTSDDISDQISDQPIVNEQKQCTTNRNNKNKNHKRQRHAEQIQQHHAASALQMDTTNDKNKNDDKSGIVYPDSVATEAQPYDTDVHDALETSSPNPNTIRAMLVRQVLQQQTQSSSSSSSSSSSFSQNSIATDHTNRSQTTVLFATELLYRMFHPVWYIRHGALLGILALLRAYIHSSRRTNCSSHSENVFGTWLHDLLARCLCVIALDRFGDFGGNNMNTTGSNMNIENSKGDAVASESNDSIHGTNKNNASSSNEFTTFTTWTIGSNSGSVVAPVREVCGQVIAILHGMTKQSIIADQTRTALFQLCEYESSWEVRHGALIAFKYMIVVELTNMLQMHDATRFDVRHDCNIKSSIDNVNDPVQKLWIESICRVAIVHLSDHNDDVKSASAHLLVEVCSRSHPEDENLSFIWEVVSPLWCILQKVRLFSSCIVDLVELCTILVDRNCRSFLNGLRLVSSNMSDEKTDCKLPSIFDLIQFLVSLLDSEFASVRTSALQSIGVLCAELGTANVLDLSDEENYFVAVNAMHDLAIYVIKLLTNEASDISIDICSISCVGKVPKGAVSRTWVLICNAIVGILKPDDIYRLDLTLLSWYFQVGENRVLELRDDPVRLQEAKALAYYLSKSCYCGTLSDVAQTMMLAYISSPWTTQVESTCLLHLELAKSLTDRSLLTEFENRICFEATSLCLNSIVWNVTIDNKSLSELCDQACLNMISDVMNGSKTPLAGADCMIHLWTKLFQLEEDHQVTLDRPTVCPLTEMRLLAVVAGSILEKGIPSKLTPVVRALMTFFHNETTSISRRELVAAFLIQLLRLITADPKYSIAYTKIVSTLCNSIAYRSCEGQTNDLSSTLASTILQSMVEKIESIRTLNDITPVWQRLQPLMTSDSSISYPSAAQLDAMDLLKVLIVGISNKDVFIGELIGHYTPMLMRLVLLSRDDATSKRAVSTIIAICNISPRSLLEATIPFIIGALEDLTIDRRRLAACGLLQKLLESAATAICPFVKLLLPRVLLLMSDNLIECSQCAANIFALLIKVAPLVQQTSLKSDKMGESRYGSAIDHLIFGKALPPCQFPIALSTALRAKGVTLRKYQEDGVSWLHFLQSVNLNGALCDDMGTGKSLQTLVAIALAHAESNAATTPSVPVGALPVVSRSLIVCPSTLVGHWVGEIEKHFSPQSVFNLLCISGSRAERLELWRRKSEAVNVIITSYSVLRSDIEYLESETWCYCVLDEGHLLKNPKTATARSSKRLRAKHKLVLTGTLIQNRIHELWATFDFLMPSFLGSMKAFAANYANPIVRSQLPNASASSIADGLNTLKLLHQQVLPFILRREKKQVLPELPRMSQTVLKVPMSNLQQRMYRSFCANRDVDVSLQSLEATFAKTFGSGHGGFSDVLKSLVFLRLLCTHPSLVLNEVQLQSCPATFFAASASGKIMVLFELLKGAIDFEDNVNAADNDATLLYCDDDAYDEDAYTSIVEIPDPCFREFKTSTGEYSVNYASRHSKCLIFAQFTKSLDAVENLLLKTHMPTLRYCRLDGSVPQNKRIDVVNLFQHDPSVRVMLLTTRVGGVGLNLTAASTVIFLEIDFNPYADLQAQDRCMRIGQTQQVNVYRIITKDSIEENILTLQDKKIQVTEAIVNSDNSTMYSMGTERLLDLFDVNTQKNSEDDYPFDFDYDLEGVVEKCVDDYKNLAVDTFTNSFLS